MNPRLALTLAAALLSVSLAGCAAPKDDLPRRQPSPVPPVGALFSTPGATAPAPGLNGRLEDPFHRSGPRTIYLLEYSEENSARVADINQGIPLSPDRVRGPLRAAPIDAEGSFALGEITPGVWGLAWPCADVSPIESASGRHWNFTRFEAEGRAERVVLKCLQPQ